MADKFTYKEFKEPKEFSYKDYTESDTVKKAKAALNTQLKKAPGVYKSQWQSSINDTMDKILNREKFTYDVNGDALYQQYKDKYVQQGKMAMQDTMGQASAMTGGYGNSYASTAGNQAYQASLQNLNDVIPELYSLALDRYNQEGQDMLNKYSVLSDRESQDYGRYRDKVSDYREERDYLAGRYDAERNYDYSKYTDKRDFAYNKYTDNRNFAYGVYSDNRNLAYQEHRNAIADSQWQKEFAESVRQYNQSYELNKSQWEREFAESQRQYNQSYALSKSQWEKEFAESQRQFNQNYALSQSELAYKKSSGSSGSGGGSSSSSSGLKNVASMSSASLVEAMQGYRADGDNTGLAAFLDDCVASGRLTEAQADSYYAQYRTASNNNKTDTTVKTSASSFLNTDALRKEMNRFKQYIKSK